MLGWGESWSTLAGPRPRPWRRPSVGVPTGALPGVVAVICGCGPVLRLLPVPFLVPDGGDVLLLSPGAEIVGVVACPVWGGGREGGPLVEASGCCPYRAAWGLCSGMPSCPRVLFGCGWGLGVTGPGRIFSAAVLSVFLAVVPVG